MYMIGIKLITKNIFFYPIILAIIIVSISLWVIGIGINWDSIVFIQLSENIASDFKHYIIFSYDYTKPPLYAYTVETSA